MFIEEFPGLIAPALCADIVACFEADPNRRASVASVAGQPQEIAARKGTILSSDDSPGLRAFFPKLIPAFHAGLDQYAGRVPAMRRLIDAEGLACTAPVVERVDPGQGFDWHYDQTAKSRDRVLAGLLYLTTIGAGGATEFSAQNQAVRPEAGKIALFPPYWTHLHRGAPPAAETKYVMSFFWVYMTTR